MSQTESNTITFLFENIDKFGMNMVAQTYQNLVSEFTPLFFTFATIYLSFSIIKMHRGHLNFNDLYVIILRMVIILTLATNYHFFCLFIYDIFTKEPLIIFHAVVNTGGGAHVASISSALDGFLTSGMKQASTLFMMGSWSNPTYLLFGSLVFLVTLITVGIAAGLIVLAKCASTILLGLSPLFIFLALFDSTKSLFDAYIKQLIAYALIPVFTSAILMILLSVSSVLVKQATEQTPPTFSMLMPFGLMCIVQIYLLLQVRTKCSSLAGGFSLPGVVSSLRQYKSDMGSVAGGLNSMVDAAKNFGGSSHTINMGRVMTHVNGKSDKINNKE